MSRPRIRTALCLTAAALAVPALASPSTSASSSAPSVTSQVSDRDRVAARTAPGASMSFSPAAFVGGQRLTFAGDIGPNGRRAIRLQVHMNRPGDTWNTIDGFRRYTRRDGSFRFTYLAPAMRDKSMRVRAGGLTTPARGFDANAQDLVAEARSGVSGLDANEVVVARPFVVHVDTTPEPAGPANLRPPAFPGRTLTLQKRIESGGPLGYATPWEYVSTGETNQYGMGSLPVPEGVDEDTVYRVRQENWTQDGDQIGWSASFPVYVNVVSRAFADSDDRGARTVASSVPPATARVGEGGSRTAGERFGWRALFDFGWAYGQSLDSKPQRGSNPVGSWIEATNGTGRVGPLNGGLTIDSARAQDATNSDPSRGTTMATLTGNAHQYARWEVRLRTRSFDRGLEDHRTRIELVPARASDYACGSRTVTIADLTPHGDLVRIGARKGGAEWSKSVNVGELNNANHSFAVEVARDHITWFREGKPIGTVGRAAVPDVPMTLRLSVGDESDTRRNPTQTSYDWMRAYSFDKGRQVRSGGSLTRGTYDHTC